MITKHFTDLYDFATRGMLDLSLGLEYVLCHRGGQVGSSAERVTLAAGVTYMHPCTSPGFVLATRGCHCQSPRLPKGMRTDPQELKPFIAYYRPAYGWERDTVTGLRVEWGHASDRGLWNVPGVDYKNTVNYMLNVRTLADHGIEIGGIK